jgi:hypothetical protein
LKTAAAILLLGILLFNWFGYRVLNTFMQDRSDLQLQSQLDLRHYDETQLVSIKLPATQLAYYNNSAVFERVDGQIDINGIPYQYVKRRIYNDSIEFLCIPNRMALNLRLSGEDYFRLINDIQHSQQGQGHPGGATKFFAVDPYTATHPFRIGDPSFILIGRINDYSSTRLLSPPGASAERPPACTALPA